MKPILHIVICSTRPGRVGPAIGQWAQQAALGNDKFEPQEVDLASFKGRVVVLNFFDQDCPHCQRDLPLLVPIL